MTDYEQWADATFVELLRLTPELPALMGLSRLPAFRDLAGRLNDYSIDGAHERCRALAAAAARHAQFEPRGLAPAQQLSRAVFGFLLEYFPFEPWVGMAGESFALHGYPVRHIDGAPTETFGVLTRSHVIGTEADAEQYLERLRGLVPALADLCVGLEYRDQRGLSPPVSALAVVIGELRSLLAAGPATSELATAFGDKLAAAPAISPASRQSFERRAGVQVADLYGGPLPGLLECLERLAARARADIGVWALPDGDDYYRYCLVRQNTTALSPDEVFELGRQEVARLRQELTADVAALGPGGPDLAASIRGLLSGDGAAAAGDAREREEILGYYRRLVADVGRRIRPFFGRFPTADCVVTATAPHLEQRRTSTYFPPSATGEQPGVFELCLLRELGRPAWARHNLAYHEAVPGHHLQLTIAQELRHLPLFRRTFLTAGYLEGWAKYAERLPFETGVDADPRYELQRKANELISASNLMLDVGIHSRRWSRESAIAFSREQALLDTSTAEWLVDRITVSPGQTTAYMLGLRSLRGLRDAMRIELGDRFTLPRFHDAVLGEGALPLRVLEESFHSGLARVGGSA